MMHAVTHGSWGLPRLGLAALALLAGLAEPAISQQRTAGSAAPGWLGIRVHWGLDCPWESEQQSGDCQSILLVDQVQVDGPADEAGIEPGDKLISFNGRELVPEREAEALGTLRPGTQATVDVARDGVPLFFRVIPIRRPSNVDDALWRGHQSMAYRQGTFVVPTRPAERALADNEIAFTIRGDSGGIVQIRPYTIRVQGGRVTLSQPEAIEGEVEVPEFSIAIDLGELRAIEDSVFGLASRKLAELRRLYAMEELSGRVLSRVRLEGGERSLVPILYGRSLAGAEFEPLSRDLAAQFDGVDGGLLVLRVVDGMPASRVGLRAGDVLIEVDGEEVDELGQLLVALNRTAGSLEIRWVRGGRVMSGWFRKD